MLVVKQSMWITFHSLNSYLFLFFSGPILLPGQFPYMPVGTDNAMSCSAIYCLSILINLFYNFLNQNFKHWYFLVKNNFNNPVCYSVNTRLLISTLSSRKLLAVDTRFFVTFLKYEKISFCLIN